MELSRTWVAATVVIFTIVLAGWLLHRGTPGERAAASEVERDRPAPDRPRAASPERGAFPPVRPELAAGPVPVEVDILPASEVNVFELDEDVRIPVAILSTPGFDAPNEVSRPLLRFGKTGRETSPSGCTTPRDVNDDGLRDLVCRFDARTGSFDLGESEAVLTGETRKMVAFRGSDSITVVKDRQVTRP